MIHIKTNTHSHEHTYLQIHKIILTPKQLTHTLQYTHTCTNIHIDIKDVFTNAHYARLTNQHTQKHTHKLNMNKCLNKCTLCT